VRSSFADAGIDAGIVGDGGVDAGMAADAGSGAGSGRDGGGADADERLVLRVGCGCATGALTPEVFGLLIIGLLRLARGNRRCG
jgi:hypothetical protein